MLKPMVFYSLALTLLLLAGAVSADSTVLKPPEVLAYHGFMYFAYKRGDSFTYNGTYFNGTVIIKKVEYLNETAAWVYVDITAEEVRYEPNICSCVACANILTNIVVMRDYRLQLKYLVDTIRNYAWINGEFIGFFPFYIFPKLSYENASKYTYIYMEEELKVVSEEGKPAPVAVKLPDNTTIHVLSLVNKYISIGFIHHYPIDIRGYIPLGNNSYLEVYLGIDESWIPYLKATPEFVAASPGYWKLVSPTIIISVILLLIIAFTKKKRWIKAAFKRGFPASIVLLGCWKL